MERVTPRIRGRRAVIRELSGSVNIFRRESSLNPEVKGHLITISNMAPQSPDPLAYSPNFARVCINICILRA